MDAFSLKGIRQKMEETITEYSWKIITRTFLLMVASILVLGGINYQDYVSSYMNLFEFIIPMVFSTIALTIVALYLIDRRSNQVYREFKSKLDEAQNNNQIRGPSDIQFGHSKRLHI